jgi:hypothetical protein
MRIMMTVTPCALSFFDAEAARLRLVGLPSVSITQNFGAVLRVEAARISPAMSKPSSM